VTKVVDGHVAIQLPTADHTPSSAHFRTFDGLRAIAATLIVLHHAGFTSGESFRDGWGPFLSRLDVGVPIFFVLSGFLIYRPFLARQFVDRPHPDNRGFYRRRVLRIFPAYWIAFLVQFAFGAIVVTSAFGFICNFFLVQIYVPRPRISLSGITQSWSLATELGFYLLLPVWVAFSARWLRNRTPNSRGLVLLAGCGGIVLFSFAFRIAMYFASPATAGGWGAVSRYWIFSLADIFALGMALAVISVWSEHSPLIRELATRLARPAWAWWLAAVAMFVFVSTQLDLATGLDIVSFQRETARQFLYGMIGLCFVLPCALGDGMRDPIRRLLTARVMIYLGGISYGIYLWHQAFIHWIPEWFDWAPSAIVDPNSPAGLFNGNFWPLAIGSFILAVIVSSLSYYLVEQPILRRFRGGLSPGRARPATPKRRAAAVVDS
jgi:peptidoglycan/LPS O-acetylase OafA/YrhL